MCNSILLKSATYGLQWESNNHFIDPIVYSYIYIQFFFFFYLQSSSYIVSLCTKKILFIYSLLHVCTDIVHCTLLLQYSPLLIQQKLKKKKKNLYYYIKVYNAHH